MNDDRISEVYKGEIWSDDAQSRARRRIHWMIAQAQCGRVLDIGCSQGIASILLGREGFEVVGIDVQESRIEYARQDLEQETAETRALVRFEVANAASLEFEDGSFDTVLLGEVIEHLAAPGKVLAEARRVLRPGGRLVLTTPFGVLPHHDHKQTYYPDDLYRLLEEYVAIVDATIDDRYFRVVGQKGGESDPAVLERLRAVAFATVKDIQLELYDLRLQVNRQARDLEKARDSLSTTVQRRDRAEQEVEHLQSALATERASAHNAVERTEKADALADRLRADLEQLQSKYDGLATDATARARKSRAREAAMRRRLDRLEHTKARLTYRVALRDWKLAALKRRRWWRLGAALGKVRRNPLTVLTLPVTVARVLTTRPSRAPRPRPPAQPLTDRETALDQARPEEPEATREASQEPAQKPLVVVPRFSVPALAAVDGDLADELATELQVFRLEPRSWRSQLDELKPALLIVDSSIADRLADNLCLEEVLEAARSARVKTVLWDRNASALAADDRARFDVIVGDGTPPDDAYQGTLVSRVGRIAPALHNPMEATRSETVEDVDLIERRIGSTTFADGRELCELAKRYRVVRLASEVDADLLPPLVASGTPLLSTDPEVEHGIHVNDGEERERMEHTLLRSDVLRARLTHPAVRYQLRHHGIHRDVAAVLGAPDGPAALPRIDVMVATKRPERIGEVIDTLGRQTYPNVGLVLVPHGIDLDPGRVRDLAAARNVALREIVPVDGSIVLGEVFNIGFAATSSDVVAKMDDDDFYGDEYLWDLYDALQFSGADVAGKWAHFVYLEGADTLLYRYKRFEHMFTELVAISTLLMHRRVLEEERFPAMPYGSGSAFLRALGAKGARVYAADRWNYLYVRGQNGNGNTFPVTDLKLLSNSDIVCLGRNIDHVVV